MEKILFFYYSSWYARYTPLDIGQIFALNRYRCDLQAVRLDYHNHEKHLDIIKKHNPDAVFLFLDSLIWTGAYAYNEAYQTARALKKENPDIFIGMQSYKISEDEKVKALNDACDCIVTNNPEQSFQELGNILQKESVDGVLYQKGN